MTISCIYAIIHLASGKRYVGSATDYASRRKKHLHMLRHGKHHSVTLQRSWSKYGEDAFAFAVLEVVGDVGDLIAREQYWMDRFQSANPRNGFNIAKVAGSPRGVKHGPEVTAKRLATLAARPPEEQDATRAKLSAARIGYRHTAATLAKMRGQKRTQETRARMSVANRGKERSPEHRAKIAATLTGRKTGPQSPETIAKRVAATKATKEARRAECR